MTSKCHIFIEPVNRGVKAYINVEKVIIKLEIKIDQETALKVLEHIAKKINLEYEAIFVADETFLYRHKNKGFKLRFAENKKEIVSSVISVNLTRSQLADLLTIPKVQYSNGIIKFSHRHTIELNSVICCRESEYNNYY